MKKRIITSAVACVSLLAASLAVTAPAAAHSRGDSPSRGTGTPVTLADGLAGPLSLEVDRSGRAWVGESFAGVLTQVNRDGTTQTLASAPAGASIGAVSARKGTVYYAQTADDHSSSTLLSVARDGTVTEVGDLFAHESSENPDQVNTYGFVDLAPECAAEFDSSVPPFLPATYDGVVDTNPYASLALRDAVYVADAGANAILRVGYDGTVSTVAVLPPGDPIEATPEILAAVGFPACAAGYDYRFEPVPTDVERGPDGWLYVTSLPGGPEDASLGARGSVYKVNPDTGETVRLATGFLGATNLAVARGTGTVYVAELFGGPDGTGQLSVIERGSDTPKVLRAVSAPAAVELRGGSLYVTTDAFVPDDTGAPQPIGTVTRFPLTGDRHWDDSRHDD
ncbi:MAG TPA: ScyD/ScyE family protein [Cryobacterium sp.]|nr:ScyD/ScyE family protein [Cryobacterium sp.]